MRLIHKKIFISLFFLLAALSNSNLYADLHAKETKIVAHIYDATHLIEEVKKSPTDTYSTDGLLIIGPLVKELRNNNEAVIKKFKAEIIAINKINEDAPGLANEWTIEYYPDEKTQPVSASLADAR